MKKTRLLTCFWLLGVALPAAAQVDAEQGNSFGWGWLGLLALVGLYGLRGSGKSARRD